MYVLCNDKEIIRQNAAKGSVRKRFHVFVASFKRRNDVTRSNAMTDVIFSVVIGVSRSCFQKCDFVVSYNKIFSIGYIGELCSNQEQYFAMQMNMPYYSF